MTSSVEPCAAWNSCSSNAAWNSFSSNMVRSGRGWNERSDKRGGGRLRSESRCDLGHHQGVLRVERLSDGLRLLRQLRNAGDGADGRGHSCRLELAARLVGYGTAHRWRVSRG